MSKYAALSRTYWKSGEAEVGESRSKRWGSAAVARGAPRWGAAGAAVGWGPAAMAGQPRRLLGLACGAEAHPGLREGGVAAASCGKVTSGLLVLAIIEFGVKAGSYPAWQV